MTTKDFTELGCVQFVMKDIAVYKKSGNNVSLATESK